MVKSNRKSNQVNPISLVCRKTGKLKALKIAGIQMNREVMPLILHKKHLKLEKINMRNDISQKNKLLLIILICTCFSCKSIKHDQNLFLKNNGMLFSGNKPLIVNNKVDDFLNYKKLCSHELEMEDGVIENSTRFLECTYLRNEKRLFRVLTENGRVKEMIILDGSIKVRNLKGLDLSIGSKLTYLLKAGNYVINFTESSGSYINLKNYPNLTFYTDCEPYMDLQNGKFNYSNMKNCLITEIRTILN